MECTSGGKIRLGEAVSEPHCNREPAFLTDRWRFAVAFYEIGEWSCTLVTCANTYDPRHPSLRRKLTTQTEKKLPEWNARPATMVAANQIFASNRHA